MQRLSPVLAFFVLEVEASGFGLGLLSLSLSVVSASLSLSSLGVVFSHFDFLRHPLRTLPALVASVQRALNRRRSFMLPFVPDCGGGVFALSSSRLSAQLLGVQFDVGFDYFLL